MAFAGDATGSYSAIARSGKSGGPKTRGGPSDNCECASLRGRYRTQCTMRWGVRILRGGAGPTLSYGRATMAPTVAILMRGEIFSKVTAILENLLSGT